jgi:hypothetical protein
VERNDKEDQNRNEELCATHGASKPFR